MNVALTTKLIDPITMEVIRNKLDGIANEMQLTLVRSSFSAIVKEGRDASASIFTIGGESLAQALANPNHLSALVPMVQHLLKKQSLESMKEGDTYVMNDPYLGGTHIPDVAIMMPVFHGGKPIAICTAMTHHQDLGGMAPGSTPTNATDIFQEGLRLPLIKIRDGYGPLNQTFLDILKQNVRIPNVVEGDLIAEISACTIGARRLSELASVYGGTFLTNVFDELLDHAERMTLDALRQLPHGSFDYEEWLDNDGVDLDRRIPIKVKVTITDKTMEMDLAGSSAQVRGPFNSMPSGILAAASFALKAVIDPTQNIPNNGGCFRPLKLHLPEGSIVNPREPAPVGCRASTIKRVTCAMLGALRKAAPSRVPADTGNVIAILHFGGKNSAGTTFVTSQMLVGGNGASHQGDGIDVIETDISNSMNIPAEALELEAPIRVHRFSLQPDSGGRGRWRGGLGAAVEYEILDGDVTVTYRGERHFCPASGAEGGEAGAVSVAEIIRKNGDVEVVPSKIVARLFAGDRLRICTPGGGGYGDPAERLPEQIAADLEDGKITAIAA